MKEKVISLIEEILDVPAGTVTENTAADDLEEWDSLAHVMIIGEMERRYGISLPLNEAVKVKSVREILDLAGIEQ